MPTHIQATEKVTVIPKPQSTLLTAPSEFLEEDIPVHLDDFTFGSRTWPFESTFFCLYLDCALLD